VTTGAFIFLGLLMFGHPKYFCVGHNNGKSLQTPITSKYFVYRYGELNIKFSPKAHHCTSGDRPFYPGINLIFITHEIFLGRMKDYFKIRRQKTKEQ